MSFFVTVAVAVLLLSLTAHSSLQSRKAVLALSWTCKLSLRCVQERYSILAILYSAMPVLCKCATQTVQSRSSSTLEPLQT
jgi:hypothetical protein